MKEEHLKRVAVNLAEAGIGLKDHDGLGEVIECSSCDRLVYFRDSWSPGDEALCAVCNEAVTGRKGVWADPLVMGPPRDAYPELVAPSSVKGVARTFFTADTHFLHGLMLMLRPGLGDSWDKQLLILVDRWNSVVRPGDLVYHLGDFALSWGKRTLWLDPWGAGVERDSAAMVTRILGKLNGRKVLITGNHDRDAVTGSPGWAGVFPAKTLNVVLPLSGEKKRITLFHYAMRTWDKQHYGGWALHGHSHGNLPDAGGKTADVGVDVWDYRPVSLEALELWMSGRDVVPAGDHHTAEQAP